MASPKHTIEEVYAAIQEHGSQAKAAKALGINVRTLERRINRAARQGYAPENDMVHVVPDGFHVKGTSTLYNKDGEVAMQWVKSNIDHERQHQMAEEMIKAMADDLPKAPKIKKPKDCSDDLMAVYPLGDPHIGMLAWAEETGQDWDMNIAREKMPAAFDRLVKSAPKCKKAVIVNLGDYLHSDNMEGVTTRSGHSLDMDGRYAKMIDIGVKILRTMIRSALEHHEEVHVINAVGNHDDTGALFLNVCMINTYENEPRVTIDPSPAPFHYVRHGKVLFGVHHGHTAKSNMLMGVMATDRARDWGETEFRYWYTGHIHHDSMKEYAGCKVESFRTLAAKDAYATWGGYRALQDSKCLVLHREFGEIERHTVNIAMV